MLKKIVLLVVMFVAPAILAQETDVKHIFVGAKTCGMCHKSEKQGKQLDIWKTSAHSKAYETLKTAEADSIAKAKGLSTNAILSEACLKCHVSGYNINANLKSEKFNMEDGVQCETCHGAGSDYKSTKIMKDEKQAVANGLKLFNTEEERVALCKGCHNSESPTFDTCKTDFAKMWIKIKHDIPKDIK
ncbi:MAG: cytochrome C554 [Ignavibacteriales bacterium CG12_big_fil_rev_8_21_14_0_65_30_8]|nr:MAG: cytochrome C554 [Ignavibacteriales bacterium CG12_big_fil_rev_8_21_14_0_65_30_8]